MIAVRAFLLDVLPTGVEVVQSQQNRVPQPVSESFVTMAPTSRRQLSASYREGDATAGTLAVGRSTGIGVQIDVYGVAATDNAQVIATLLRDDYGCRFLAPYNVQPLYCDDGSQMPLVNGEQQYEQRWMLRAMFQANPYVSTPAAFPAKVDVETIQADR